mmetsp:Transcript_12386/g.33788  ORF Transcript_12386/g.33788 Transcript_12386/m.33788 type:complete len:565 (+) Transcript_12386:69-1763(+)
MSTVALENGPREPSDKSVYTTSRTYPLVQDKRYTKAELLGQGACKKVFKAFDEAEGIEVAWNEVHVTDINFAAKAQAETRDRIFGEIKLLKQLKHKNILAMHDWWLDQKNSTLIFITELFMDGSLRTYRRKHRNIDVTVLKRWAWQILQGLVYLHGHNPPIIHRDLKSDNIFINGTSGTIKIGDLGFATFLAGFSAAMSVIGTPEFMAPELYEEQYTEKVDVYSFGLCIMELATLEYPYNECRNPAQIFRKVTQGIPPMGVEKIQDIELREFVELCIRHDPEQRPEARQLLKHPFFDAVRDPMSLRKNLASLQLSSSGLLPPASQQHLQQQQQQQAMSQLSPIARAATIANPSPPCPASPTSVTSSKPELQQQQQQQHQHKQQERDNQGPQHQGDQQQQQQLSGSDPAALAARMALRLAEHQAAEFAATVESQRREMVRVRVRERLDKKHGRTIREHNLPRFLAEIGVPASKLPPPLSTLPTCAAKEAALKRSLRQARVLFHPDKVQAQLVAADAAAREATGPRGGQPPRHLLKAARDALEELVRAEEICKILNSFDLNLVPGL